MKPLKPQGLLLSRNNHGSAFIQALVAIAVVGALVYFLTPTVIKNRQQVTKSASIITARLALHSMLDFTLLGVKQRWCFSDSWMPENCGKSENPTTAELLSHPRSVERVLMKQETVDFLKTMGYAAADQAPLQKITARIPVANFSSLHPIYKIISDLKGYKVTAFDVTIERDLRGIIPEYGREVYLKVTVSLLNQAGEIIQVGSSRLTATSFVGVYPREVGSFALLVANDLHLDVASGGGLQVGDSYIRQFSSKAERAQYPGLVFDSPVFVNGSIYLPKTVDDTQSDTVYSPVSFNEKVIMGDGPIMRGGKEFRPATAGGDSDQFWSSIREFGGFQKGVDVDGGRDGGLDNLSGKSAATSVNKDLMQQCIDRTLAMTDLRKTVDSTLRGVLSQKTSSKFDYRLGLTLGNVFTRQRGEVGAPTVTKGRLASYSLSNKNGAIAQVTLNFDGLSLKADIPDNGTLTLAPKIDLSQLKNSISAKISDAQSTRDKISTDLTNLDRDVRSAEKDVASIQSNLAAEQGKYPQDQRHIADLQADLDRANNKLDSLKNQRMAKEKDFADAKAKLDDYQNQLVKVEAEQNVQPTIKISVDAPNPDSTNPVFKDFHVEFEHGELLVNSMGTPQDVSLYLQAYDVAFDRGYPLRLSIKTNGYLNFKRSGADFIPYNNVSDNSGNSKGDLPGGDINMNMDVACATQGTSGSTAFAGTDWGTVFTGTSTNSWSFTNKYEDRTNYIFDGSNASRSAGTASFIVKSIAKDCIIKSSADFVSGFLTCERLIIESRTTALRIIGSIIVTKAMEIDDKAYAAGIRWSTIYHPQATFELRQVGILKGQNNVDCSSINRFPVWHPYPSITDVSNLYRCNAISLRSKADPFRWTTVDPDCGAIEGKSSHVCKNRMVRFYVLEVSRESGI